MSDDGSKSANEKRLALEAANWLVRSDAGLTPPERAEFERWLAANPKNREQFYRHQEIWAEVDLLAAERSERNAALGSHPTTRALSRRPFARLIAVAAVMAAACFLWHPWTRKLSVDRSVAPAQAYDRRVLEDGSVVELNRGAAVEVHFTAAERRVRLLRGEASFTVAKNPLRPFLVGAGAVEVRAVGTAFDVRLGAASVEVLVTEGHVRVNSTPSLSALEGPVLAAGELAVVSFNLVPRQTRVIGVSAEAMSRILAWRPKLLDFTSTPLSEVVAEFNRHNRVQLVIADPALRSIPIVASFRSDNVEGFVRLLEITAGVQAEPRGEEEIVLRRKP